MKFLCIDCDSQMTFEERQIPGDGTFAASFTCPKCGRRVAMLANPAETQLVNALGVKIGGRTLEEQPMELVRGAIVGREDAFRDESVPTEEPTGRHECARAGARMRKSVWRASPASCAGW
jgi:hypothetical protein